MERQTKSDLPEQLRFNLEGRGVADHGQGSEAVSGTAGQVAEQVSKAEEGTRAWEQELMERVAEEANLVEALGRVCANKASAGIDQMSVAELRAWMSQRSHRAELREKSLEGGALGVAPQSQEKLKGDLRALGRRNGGQSLAQVIGAVNEKRTGWIQYFHLARMKSVLEDLSQWLGRRVRSLKLKQCRRTYAIARFLRQEGGSERSAWMLALSGKGWWRLADTPQAHRAMSRSWFKEHGLIDPEAVYLALHTACR